MFAFLWTLDAQIIDTLCQLDEGAVEESPGSPTLVQEIPNTYTSLWIRITEASVARLHRRGNIFGLASLVWASVVAIENLKDENSIVESIDGPLRVFLDNLPSTLCDLGGRVSPRIRYQASICLNKRIVSCQDMRLSLMATHVYDRLIVFDAAQDFQTAQLPLAAFGCIYRANLKTAVDRCRIAIYELDCALRRVSITRFRRNLGESTSIPQCHVTPT